MPENPARPLWLGRTAALLGIILIALNLRTAVAALSPITDQIGADVPLDALGLGVLGMLPPIAFALSGFLAPFVARRIGLETTFVLACAAMVAGPIIRAVAGNYLVLVLGTVVALAGMGFGNILLPPAVKKYFPDRIAQITTSYVLILAVSASVPPIFATPVADLAGWRVSLAVWAVLALTAFLPWLVVRLQHRRAAAAEDAAVVVEAPPELVGRLWHSKVAWALALTLGVSALSVYSFFAWLPRLLVDRAGSSPVEAGALLALFGIVAIPSSLIVPSLAARLRNVGWIIVAAVALYLAGYLGLLLVPTVATWLWVSLTGLGPLLFPLVLTLINLRTRSPEASVALSGFVQGIGYGVGALGPLAIALIHDSTGAWDLPLVFLLVTSVIPLVAAVMLRRPIYLEDELAARGRS